MAKILVADDNSNVQKTVGLALADLGIEVVAVNNGEAAVRKLPDVMPDLVLADIFMPVRNGYEVCEYVKKDSRFSHVPVVLLVGAFDPLDEREAQRVGADGILKKPFVPPDPLIAMVKNLLERTLGDRLVPAAVSKPALSKQSRSGSVAVADDHESAHSMPDEAQAEVSSPKLGRLSFADGNSPVAFSQLLDSPAMEVAVSRTQFEVPADNDQILTSSRDESLGAPIFWKTETSEKEILSGDSDEESDASTEIPAVGWRLGNEPLQSPPAESDSKENETDEPLELVLDDKDAAHNQVSMIVEPSPLRLQDAASQASLHVEASKAPDLAANPLEWMASVPPPKEEEVPVNVPEWSAAVPKPTALIETKDLEKLEPAIELAQVEMPVAAAQPASSSPEATPPTISETALLIPEHGVTVSQESHALNAEATPIIGAQRVEDRVRSIPKQDWTDLAASLQLKSAEPILEELKPPTVHEEQPRAEQEAALPTPLNSAPPTSKPAAQNAEDTAHSLPKHDWADLVSDLKSKSGDSNGEKTHSSLESVNLPSASAVINTQPAAAAPVTPVSKSSNSSLEDTARSMPKLDWADLAASIQPRPSAPAIEKAKPASPTFLNASPASPANGKSASSSPLATAPMIPGNLQNDDASASPAASAATDSTSPAGPDPALVEAVVQRVLDKMRPQVVDIITKEFLRPVVQALVHREITKR